jgi:aconitate hydratase
MTQVGDDTLGCTKKLTVDGATYHYLSFQAAEAITGDITRLPYSLKILLENLLRHENGRTVSVNDIKAMGEWLQTQHSTREIAFRPARVLMQDFTGVPAVVDLAAMREAIKTLGGDPRVINPLAPVDLVIDHSVMVDEYASPQAFHANVSAEYHRNRERYKFLRWGQSAFNNFRVVPPGTGICHQVNLEYLGQTVWSSENNGKLYAYPDTLVGTDSHTTMINGLGVLGWGVGGIEAEAAMLGQPISMLIPEVVGFKLTGQLREGATATDLVLTVTQMLRQRGVVGKFVEFYGSGLDHLSLADRATIGNMAPEYGATCGIFPIDQETLRYLAFTGRDPHRVRLVEAYAKTQGLWRDHTSIDPIFTETLELDLGTVEPSLAGPKRPQDKVPLSKMVASARDAIQAEGGNAAEAVKTTLNGTEFDLKNGDVVIAAITSCTNTSNPSVMLGAGLVAKRALERGLRVKPWVKTSLAPGSQVVTDYLDKAGLTPALNELGFNLVGYGCTTCIGNSGPLLPEITAAIKAKDLAVAGVLSGNRNFEGRIHPHVKLNYLASPMLVVAYALAGTITIDLLNEPLGQDAQGQDVYLKDIWPSNAEIAACVRSNLTPQMFRDRYANVFAGDAEWQSFGNADSLTYNWDATSTYVKLPPFFADISPNKAGLYDIADARVLALLGDSITTDHISPAGSIKEDGPAGEYLKHHGVMPTDFNSYGSRRGNHEVMMRGTFANIRLSNEMVPHKKGGYTAFMPEGVETSLYDAAMKYQEQGTPLVIFAGKEYGTGSSRDWAAKGTRLLGVQAVIAESFERIHRSNLIGMGVLPLVYKAGETRKTLQLTGAETISIIGLKDGLTPGKELQMTIQYPDGRLHTTSVIARLDTVDEVEYFENGGILHYVLRRLMQQSGN